MMMLTEMMMEIETVDQPTVAELELETSLKQLRDAIANVPEGERQSLSTILASLHTLDEAMAAEDPRRFVQALVGLARAVIEVRQAVQFAAFPVPPYDLWLPFKAASLRPSDQPSSRYTAAGAVRNKKIASEVSVLQEMLEPKNNNPQQIPGGSGEAQERK